MKRLFWLALLFPVLTVAQVQKCTIEGKTVYSDSLCGQSGRAVDTTANTIDHSGLRQQAAMDRAADAAAADMQKRAEAKQRKAGERAASDRNLKKSLEGLRRAQTGLAEAHVRQIQSLKPP